MYIFTYNLQNKTFEHLNFLHWGFTIHCNIIYIFQKKKKKTKRENNNEVWQLDSELELFYKHN